MLQLQGFGHKVFLLPVFLCGTMINMSKVLVTLKVMPKDADSDINEMEKEIKSSISPDKIVREPIAFGLVALKVSIFVEDSEGQVDSLEGKLRAIDSVGEVEVVEVSRLI